MPIHLLELEDILYSGFLSYGKWGKRFETKLQDYIGINQLLVTNTYSSAIQIALTALDLKSGDEVIASPMSCLASNQPLATFGLKIVWADIDPSTGTLNPDEVKGKITPKTKLIFHNHFCGYIGYVDEINAIGKEYGIPVIDDCVEAFGSKYKNKIAGNLDVDITLFSFQTVRLPNTMDGGAIVFNNKELFEKALLIRDFGIRRSIFRDKNNEISPDCDISLHGYGATMSEVNSYIGCMQMDGIEQLLSTQQDNAVKWNEWFDRNLRTVRRLNQRKDTLPNYWVYGVLADDKMKIMLKFREKGFYASGVHLNNNIYTVFQNKIELKGVNNFMNAFFAIPTGWWVEREQIESLQW